MEETIIALLTAIIGGAFKFTHDYAKTRLTPERLATVGQLARVAVEAAEEIGRATDASPGDKFTYAENFLTTAAKRVGVKLSNEEANGFIHSVLNGNRSEVERQVNEIISDIFANIEDEEPVVAQAAPAPSEGA